MDVSVRHLKAHLSEILDRAAGGEVIRVTDRGRPKAILSPLPTRSVLDTAASDGWARPALLLPARPVHRSKSEISVQSSLDEDRGD